MMRANMFVHIKLKASSNVRGGRRDARKTVDVTGDR
jgi:hypothetical protein